MGFNLTIDQGNSAAKIAVWDGQELVFDDTTEHFQAGYFDKLALRYPVDAAICCSVRGNTAEIVQTVERITNKVYDMGEQTKFPLTISYKTPDTLGRDRLAAATGAWDKHKGHWLLVVDMGTAITYDLVSPRGEFLGGNIAPGVRMRVEILHQFTANLPAVPIKGDCPQWGYDTETALRAGAVGGIVGEMEHYRSLLPQEAKVILTGGAAPFFEKKVDFPVEVDQHLVTKGLNCILLYNENK